MASTLKDLARWKRYRENHQEEIAQYNRARREKMRQGRPRKRALTAKSSAELKIYSRNWMRKDRMLKRLCECLSALPKPEPTLPVGLLNE